jgi:hypothetical protein
VSQIEGKGEKPVKTKKSKELGWISRLKVITSHLAFHIKENIMLSQHKISGHQE